MASGRMEFHADTIMQHTNFSFVLPNDFIMEEIKDPRHYDRPTKSLILLHGLTGTDTDWLYGDPQAVRLRPIRPYVENEPGSRRIFSIIIEAAELIVLFERGCPLHVTNRRRPFCDQADSFALPFARRLASTLRPLAVDILFRKPCSMER